MPARFEVPEVEDYPDGWGPSTVPEHLDGVPYAPFVKGDKVGKISDFTQSGFGKFGNNRLQQPGQAGLFNFFQEDEDSFHLVDSRPVQRGRGGRRFQQNRFQQRRNDMGRREDHQDRQPRKQQQRRQFNNFRDNQRQITYSSSVDIRPEWGMVEQIQFAALGKLSMPTMEGQEMRSCGSVEYYDKSFDRVTPKNERSLKRTQRVFRSVTTSDDPIIRQLASEDQGRVFVTDALLTTLMCTTRSVYSWDIVVTRAGDKLFFDKRDGSNLDMLTVAETAPEAVPEEKDNMNGVQQLSLEATAINQSFSQQVLTGGPERLSGKEDNPFASNENEKLASVLYRHPAGAWVIEAFSQRMACIIQHKYQKFSIGEDIDLIVRCELDGVISMKGQDQLLSIKALNEFDSKTTGVDWRSKLENQRGAVLATELKNNANKLAKWTAAAVVAGADMIRIGYVSRAHARDNMNHTILGTQGVKPKDFASQINLNMDNCWGIVRALVDMCLKLDEGKYLIVKDPNKQLMRLYTVPDDAFETNYTEEPLPENEEGIEAPEETAKKDDGDDED